MKKSNSYKRNNQANCNGEKPKALKCRRTNILSAPSVSINDQYDAVTVA